MELFQIKDLSFTYPEQERKALDSINMDIDSGEFISICGKSGCGKSTLLRHLKPVLTPHGNRIGEINYKTNPIKELSFKKEASEIGYVLQNPDNQIVTDKVWHELAFGLESLGEDNATIRLRTAEMANFFGIEEWFLKNVSELSGGQKQLLNLASIMAMQPEVLILDEPTSQLDPIAASDFLKTIYRINRELGTTIIITEHRLEDTFPVSDRVIVLDEGRVIVDDKPSMVAGKLKKLDHSMFLSMPTPVQIYAGIENVYDCPLTVRDGRRWIDQVTNMENTVKPLKNTSLDKVMSKKSENEEIAIELQELWFRYEKNGRDIIKDLNIKIPKGTHYAILGGNGTGKTTTLSLITGVHSPYRGKILLHGIDVKKKKNSTVKIAMLPQNPQSLFVKKTVQLDLLEMVNHYESKDERLVRVTEIARKTDILHVLESHPFDLSGGEQQRAALAKVLLTEPDILLLDEPTKGMDNYLKKQLAKILDQLLLEGKTVVTVSHDIEFCAEYAQYCALFFGGNLVTQNDTKKFFSGNSFYTTAANRMCRHLFQDAITIKDVIEKCKGIIN